MAEVLSYSEDLLVKQCFARKDEEDKSSAGGFTTQQFKASMVLLLDTLGDSSPSFIRCLKPNQTKIPGDYEFKAVVAQLNSLSVIDALQLAQKGYPARSTFEDFTKEFHVLSMYYGLDEVKAAPEERALKLLEKVGDITPNDYQKGTTKMFLKKTTARLLDSKQHVVLRGGQRLVEDL